jgi:hypothetical protein
VNAKTKARSDAVLWSIVVAVLITGGVHALAMMLPDWFSARSSRNASSFEKFASRFSEVWLANAFVLAAIVAVVCFVIVLALLLWRATAAQRRVTAASQAGSGAE